MKTVLETERLALRRMTWEDEPTLAAFLQDPQVMYAWEHGFSQEEVKEWIEANLARYERDGHSYLAAVEKGSGDVAGVCGLIEETACGAQRLGVGYIFNKTYWGRGYATECARACVEHAFTALGAKEVTAQIRPENAPSRRVAERLGMTVETSFVKVYRGKEMPHLLYVLHRS